MESKKKAPRFVAVILWVFLILFIVGCLTVSHLMFVWYHAHILHHGG